jgi:hypothetical protein
MKEAADYGDLLADKLHGGWGMGACPVKSVHGAHPSNEANIHPAPSTATTQVKINAVGPKAVITTPMAALLSANPLTVMTVVAFCDHDPNRPLAASSVVPRHFLRTTDILVV